MKQDDEDFLAQIAEPLRAPVEMSAGFEARVMESVGSLWRNPAARTPASFPAPVVMASYTGTGAERRENSCILAWIVRPRVLRLSPLAGLAAAAGIAIAVLSLDRASSERAAPEVAATLPAVAAVSSVDTVKLVQFMLVAQSASSVSVVGDFNDWDPTATPLREAAGAGVWTVTVPLSAGRHQYVFMVNGTRWTPDPAAPVAVEDSFGMPNSVITVGESAT